MKKINKRKALLIIMLLLIVSVILITSVSFAKYVTQVRGKVFAKLEDEMMEMKDEETITLVAKIPKTSYNFDVKNYKEYNNENLIETQYYIEIVSQTDKMQFELYDENGKVELNNQRTDLIYMPKTEKQEHKYRLDIV